MSEWWLQDVHKRLDATQEVREKDILLGDIFIHFEPMEDMVIQMVLSSILPLLPNAAVLFSISA